MFESMKLRIIQGRRLSPFATAKVLQEHEDRISALENASDVTPEPVTRDIHIDVTDGTDAISGASVVIGEVTRTTGEAGGCNFSDLEDGEYEVTVTASGYFVRQETITVSASETTFEIELVEDTG